MRRILYEDVARDMKEKILKGIYPVGSYIPTENELEVMYDVSKVTIRRAIEILTQDGYLEKKSGKGTTVLSNRTFNKLSKASSYSSILEESGHDIVKKVRSVKLIKQEDVPDTISLKTMPSIVKYERVYEFEGKPYIYFIHYVAVEGDYKILEKQDVSLYAWMYQNGVEIDRINDAFAISEVPSDIKEVLLMDKESLLMRTRSSFDHQGNCVEFAISYYNTEIHPYEVQYQV